MSGYGIDNKLSFEHILYGSCLNVNNRLCIYTPSEDTIKYLYFYRLLNGRREHNEIAKYNLYNLKNPSLEYSDAKGEDAPFIETICSFFYSILCARYYIEDQAQRYDFILFDNVKASYCSGDTISFCVGDKSATYDFRWGELTGDQEAKKIIDPFCCFVAILMQKFGEGYLKGILRKVGKRCAGKEKTEAFGQENTSKQLAELVVRLGWRCQSLQDKIDYKEREIQESNRKIRQLNESLSYDEDDGWNWRREVD